MENNGRNFKVILEIIQWALLGFIFFACLFICPNVKQYIKNDEKKKLYQQIHYDKKVEQLNQEKIVLLDSISNIHSDTVYVVKYRVVTKKVYVDTCMTAN